jgi:hypothetical protein
VTCITPPSRLPHREAGTLEYVKHRSVLREYISLEASDPLSRAIVASIEAGLERLAGRIANSKRPLSEGTYMLRSNVHQWTDEELWKTCIQLTEAEAAFRIHKSDLAIRPVWDPKAERIKAHILICFLGYALWKTLQPDRSQAILLDRLGLSLPDRFRVPETVEM